MKVIIEVNSSNDFDYEYMINWLNFQLVDSGICYADVEADIISVDRRGE
jgi:hypothetical protein